MATPGYAQYNGPIPPWMSQRWAASFGGPENLRRFLRSEPGKHVGFRAGPDAFSRSVALWWMCWALLEEADDVDSLRILLGDITFFTAPFGSAAQNLDVWPPKKTILMTAAGFGRVNCVRALVDVHELAGYECNVNHRAAGSRRTALHHAAFNAHPETVQFLLDHGADPTAVNSHGESPAMAAAAGAPVEGADPRAVQRAQCISMLP